MFNDVKGIVVDAGHGGSDPGASGNGIAEKEYNLKILIDILLFGGINYEIYPSRYTQTKARF